MPPDFQSTWTSILSEWRTSGPCPGPGSRSSGRSSRAAREPGVRSKGRPRSMRGGKFRLRFASVLGGTQNLEVDVSYVARLPLLPGERRAMSSSILGEDCEVPCLAFEELAAGKYVALLSRLAARDFYDAASLLRIAPDLPDRPGFRLAFVCQVAASRADFRGLKTV